MTFHCLRSLTLSEPRELKWSQTVLHTPSQSPSLIPCLPSSRLPSLDWRTRSRPPSTPTLWYNRHSYRVLFFCSNYTILVLQPAVSVSLVYMGSEIWARGYGVKSKAESSGPPDHDTIFRIGSISKVFSVCVCNTNGIGP